jgi:hypothetical protein
MSIKFPPLHYLLTLAAILSACVNSQPQPTPGAFIEAPANTPFTPKLDQSIIPLPEANLHGTLTLEETLAQRRSIRQFQDILLTQAQIGQLLWAAQGVTDPTGLRTQRPLPVRATPWRSTLPPRTDFFVTCQHNTALTKS